VNEFRRKRLAAGRARAHQRLVFLCLFARHGADSYDSASTTTVTCASMPTPR
jgi:hypothetical protein